MSANEKQIGGSHYKTKSGHEHWDVVTEHDLNYFEGQITKYVMRCRKKNGKEDLEKALHFLEKYLEVYDKMNPPLQAENPKIEARFPEEAFTALALFESESWQCEGYYGDHTQLYRCRNCRVMIRCRNLDEATQIHGDCPGKSYVDQDKVPT